MRVSRIWRSCDCRLHAPCRVRVRQVPSRSVAAVRVFIDLASARHPNRVWE
jgi:hypothetical protein